MMDQLNPISEEVLRLYQESLAEERGDREDETYSSTVSYADAHFSHSVHNPEESLLAMERLCNLLITILSDLELLKGMIRTHDTQASQSGWLGAVLLQNPERRQEMIDDLKKGKPPEELLALFSQRKEIAQTLRSLQPPEATAKPIEPAANDPIVNK